MADRLVRPGDRYPITDLTAYNMRKMVKPILDRARAHAALNNFTLEMGIVDLMERGLKVAEAERRAARRAKSA